MNEIEAIKMKPQFRVWWIPQIPGKAFEVEVDTLEEGLKLCDVLIKYDLFQFENNIKPAYCNVGGISWKHPKITEGEWWDVNPYDEFDMEELHEMLSVWDQENLGIV